MFLIRSTFIVKIPFKKRTRSGYRTLKIPLCLTKEEHAALKAICTEERISRSTLLEAFIADVTQSSRCVAPLFDHWLEQRGFSHPELSCYGRYETPATTPDVEIARRYQWLLRWHEKALAERKASQVRQP
jgi:hypothetical protein